jgi:Holliday junction resolvase-like predicted endonuclease
MELSKSSRHSKITGDFAEHLVLYWLSKYGFECAKVDHTGIDLIARNPHTNEVMGISVKSRSRSTGKESEQLNIPADNFEKAEKACQAFDCVPYFAIVVDAGETIYVFILAMSELRKASREGLKVYAWKMRPRDIEQYRKNPKIITFEFTHRTHRWFSKVGAR